MLSVVFKRNLNDILLKYRLKDYPAFYKIKNSIETKLENGEFKDLKKEALKLKKIIQEGKMSLYYERLLKQLLYLVESVIEKTINNNYEISLEKLIEAMKITIPEFSLSDYTAFVYNSIEIRILINIAFILEKQESVEKSIEILLFCLSQLEPKDIKEKIRLYYNLSYSYHLLSNHEKALYYADLGIKTCIEAKTLNGLSLLYFRKGIAEYHLKRENYKDSLVKAMHLFDILGQEKLKEMAIESCKKFYNIDISIESSC
ncbi:hypothetical protein TTE2716 [Caldanaerobacter subterraneus subsp. tengcongensis MB4]|uniref:Transcriptional regulator n=1 Tax=Caldanaerobacter subterraneus subsp. tengcongensis (strain DSM 15242 / JCM 11007 / NBRC 100824 / MB4) TaxID=273068 RepID=Q8R6S1_CALS4|nr:hypothetical protein TTE2716 [Caldanaerobacter subterraneus subsp. tengcongensis MB4]